MAAPIVFLHTARPNVAMVGELMTRLAIASPDTGVRAALDIYTRT